MTSLPPPGHQPASHRRQAPILRIVAFSVLAAGALGFLLVAAVTWWPASSPTSPDASGDTRVDQVAIDTQGPEEIAADEAAVAGGEGLDPTPVEAPSDLTVDSSFRVTEVTPTEGSTIGGEAVVITGSGFRFGVRVRVGDRDAPQVEVLNETKLRVVLPPGLPGDADIEVSTAFDVPFTAEGLFSYVDRPPRVVMAVRPTAGPLAGGTAITIVGTGFEAGARVVLGGARATDVQVIDSTRITAVTGAGPEGFVDVVVRNPDMPAAILSGAFEYVRAPTLWGVEPFEIPYEGGVTVTVTGSGFEPGIQVGFNGFAGRDVTVIDEGRLTVVAPPGTPGPITVAVVNPGQPMATLENAGAYVVLPDPTPEPVPVPTEAENPDPATPPADPAAEAPAPEEGAPAAG